MQVLFAIQSNLYYRYNDEATPNDAPDKHSVISFVEKDFLHIYEKFNQYWWIGRVVKEGSFVGFVPTPEYLELLRRERKLPKPHAPFKGPSSGCKSGKQSVYSSFGSTFRSKFTSVDLPNIGVVAVDPKDANNTDPTKTTKSLVLENGALGPVKEGSFSNATILPNDSSKVDLKSSKKGLPATSPKATRAKKNRFGSTPFYYITPHVRPVVIVGPSLKGFEVTDMMQRAIFDFIKRHFEGRVCIAHIEEDISIAKRSVPSNPTKRAQLERTLTEQRSNNIQAEINRIYSIAHSLNLLVLDADTIDLPEQLDNSCLAPIVIALKIASPKVLQRLIKSRGKSQSRYMQAQMTAHEKLNKCNPNKIDLILDDNQLPEACQQLAAFLEAYWSALHSCPLLKQSVVEEGCSGIGNTNKNNSFLAN